MELWQQLCIQAGVRSNAKGVRTVLQGVIPAIVTPTRNQRVSLPELELYVRWVVDQGVQGLYAFGTTGEGVLIPDVDWAEAVRTVVMAAAGRVPVVVQCGGISLHQTQGRIAQAVASGVDGIAVVAPYFYHYGDEAVRAYYQEIVSSWPTVKVYLYNIPAYSHNDIAPGVYQQIAQDYSNVVGIKDSSGNPQRLQAYLDAVPGRAVLTGSDALYETAYGMGATGVVTGVGAALPSLAVAAWNGLKQGDARMADRVNQVQQAFHRYSTIQSARVVLAASGFAVGESFRPLLGLVATDQEELLQSLAKLGIELPGDK
ncbi:dihydrodipicolinate synthase family protein [Alicyclobacillaceae bacterium I2511]|nr:dihydrodipicolinate synthase family protein [Alicyclobacillaceae bacterium I2511]